MYSSRAKHPFSLFASGLSVCILVAVGAGCSASNGPSEIASQPNPSCSPVPPVPQGPPAIKAVNGVTYAYAVNTTLNKISRYTLDGSTGALTKQGEVDADFQPTFVAAHRTRDLVYATAFCSDKVLAYSIDTTTGALTSLGSVAAGDGPASLTVGSNAVYVTNFNSDTVSVYEIKTDGTLALAQTLPTGTSPSGIGIDRTGQLAYVVNHTSQNGRGTVSGYKIDTITGRLEAIVPVDPIEFETRSGPYAITMHPNQPFMYVANKNSNSISAYGIDETTGQLTNLLVTTAFPTELGPKGLTIDPSGKVLYVGSGHANQVSIHAINPGGTLQTPPSTVGAGEEPEGIVVDPTGKFVYTVNVVTRDISAYTISDATTGALTFLSHFPL